MRTVLQTHRGAVVQVFTGAASRPSDVQLLQVVVAVTPASPPQSLPPNAPKIVGVPTPEYEETPEAPVIEIAAQTLVEIRSARLSRVIRIHK